MHGFGKITVSVPAKDEEAHIGACLRALGAQTVRPDVIVLYLNNCADRTPEICRMFASSGNIRIFEEKIVAAEASAGEARRRALDHAAALCGNGVILTTDADSRPAPDWIAKNLGAMADGADVVCGKAQLCPEDARQIRYGLHFDDMREMYLLALLDEIESAINPDRNDPWPRHAEESGASIALRAETLRRIGGAPFVASGEDRALVARCRMIDLKIRHDPEIVVEVSGRVEGRAKGGMAETIKRRIHRQDEFTDALIEPAIDAYRRSIAKARFRACWAGEFAGDALAADLLVENGCVESLMASPYFGAAWDALQRASPVLQRRRVAYAALARETRQALQLRDGVRPLAVDDHAL